MKPVSPRRSAIVAALDIGTSKIVCLIARLEPQAPQEVLRRRSHGVRVLGFGHTASRGMKAGGVIDLVEAEEVIRQAVDVAESAAGGAASRSWYLYPAGESAASGFSPISNSRGRRRNRRRHRARPCGG